MLVNRRYIIAAIALALYPTLFCVGYLRGRSSVVLPQADTTITYVEKVDCRPKEAASLKVGRITIPSYVIGDTLHIHDTTYVIVDREQKSYHGENYDAWISGYEPELDSIKVREKNTEVIRYQQVEAAKKPNQVFVRAQGVYSNGWFTPITANYGYEFGPMFVYGGAGYDIVRKQPVIQAGLELKFKWR